MADSNPSNRPGRGDAEELPSGASRGSSSKAGPQQSGSRPSGSGSSSSRTTSAGSSSSRSRTSEGSSSKPSSSKPSGSKASSSKASSSKASGSSSKAKVGAAAGAAGAAAASSRGSSSSQGGGSPSFADKVKTAITNVSRSFEDSRPAPGQGDGQGAGKNTKRPTRRARLRLTRVDPWSVAKMAFLLSIALGVVTVVAVSLVWGVLDAAGVWDSINAMVYQVIGSDSNTDFDVENYLGTSRVIGFTLIVAGIDVLLLTAIATLAAFLYNLGAALLGGVEVTLAEDGR